MEDHQLTSFDEVLANGTIMENVFKFLPLRNLKFVRLVSTSWRDIVSPIFRRRTIAIIDGNKGMVRFLEAFATTPSYRVTFRNYRLDHINGDRGVMDAFWEKFGPSMETIWLRWVMMVGVQIVRDTFFNMCPKLRSISIQFCRFYGSIDFDSEEIFYKELAPLDENVRVNKNLTSFRYCGGGLGCLHGIPISWEEIFVGYPNLRDLSLYDLSTGETDKILEIVKSRKTRDPNCLQLQQLDIFQRENAAEEIEPQIMDRFISLQLSLKDLSIDLGTRVNSKKVARLLQQQMNVKKFALFRGAHAIPMAGFPFGVQFKHLRYLEMTDTISDCMGFLKYMPNLSMLELCDRCDDSDAYSNTINVITRTDINFTQMPLETKLTTLHVGYEISASDVRKLIFWFPGVVKAELHLDDEGFRSMCGGWSKLEELDVYGTNITTEGITGISKPKVEATESSTDSTPETERNPKNITCLTNLRKLTMMAPFFKPIKIDDVCVDEGFLKMQCLNYLEICTEDITDEGWTKLYNWKQLLTLNVFNGMVFRK